ITGGCGFWTGLGQHHIGPKFTISPWYSDSSWVQIALHASTFSRSSVHRVLKSVPWSPISSRFQPAPTPKMKRPLDTRSTLATDFAVWMGSRWIKRQIPVATRIVFDARAATVSATNGSIVCQYCFGSSPPAGHGDWRLDGICEG